LLSGEVQTAPPYQTASTYGGSLSSGTSLAFFDADNEQLLSYTIPSYYTE
jgi:hypothetical protein